MKRMKRASGRKMTDRCVVVIFLTLWRAWKFLCPINGIVVADCAAYTVKITFVIGDFRN